MLVLVLKEVLNKNAQGNINICLDVIFSYSHVISRLNLRLPVYISVCRTPVECLKSVWTFVEAKTVRESVF